MKKNISERIEISCLLSRFLGTGLDSKEQIQFENWLQEDVAHRDLLDELIDTEKREKRSDLIKRINMDAEWERFQKNSAPKTISMPNRWLEIARYAAVIALPMLIAGYLLLQNYNDSQLAVNLPVIEPGTQTAHLILSNGEKIALDEMNLSMKEANNQVIIENKERTLNYTSVNEVTNKSSTAFNELLIGKGEEYQLVLSDGTRVWLNSETRLKFPVQFSNNRREVFLEGEAYFEVSKNPEAPFIVKTGPMDIEVLGTSFNVSAYKDEASIQTTLVEGKVKVSSNIGQSLEQILKPNEQAVFSKSNNQFEVIEVNAALYASWREGIFVFDEENLDDILRKLSRWYDINVFFQSEEVRSYQFSGKLPRFKNCNELLDMIEKTTDVQFTMKENRTVIVNKK
jgi:ferric-dicitrate binding protein FerR (iron transport regulator)